MIYNLPIIPKQTQRNMTAINTKSLRLLIFLLAMTTAVEGKKECAFEPKLPKLSGIKNTYTDNPTGYSSSTYFRCNEFNPSFPNHSSSISVTGSFLTNKNQTLPVVNLDVQFPILSNAKLAIVPVYRDLNGNYDIVSDNDKNKKTTAESGIVRRFSDEVIDNGDRCYYPFNEHSYIPANSAYTYTTLTVLSLVGLALICLFKKIFNEEDCCKDTTSSSMMMIAKFENAKEQELSRKIEDGKRKKKPIIHIRHTLPLDFKTEKPLFRDPYRTHPTEV
jgi:hypothetical protein